MKNSIKRAIQWFAKQAPKPVGRWNNEYCDVKTNKKVDFSNYDHCGPCGQYTIQKDIIQKQTSKSSILQLHKQ